MKRQNASAPNKPQAPRRRAAAPKKRRPAGVVALAVVCVLALGLGVLLDDVLFPDGFVLSDQGDAPAVAQIHASSTVQLNEVMSSNSSLLRDANGETPDWFEIRNAGSEAVNLRGWTVAKVANATSAFTFPEHILQPGECVLVFADSVLRNTPGYDYHAPFSIKAAGDTLMLFNENGTAVDTVNIPELKKNTVYRRVDGVWEISNEYTPGMDNTHENYQSMIEATVDSPVVVSEVMASNASYAPAEDGQYYDYIELYNTASEQVDLSGWYLSDDREENAKWRIPDDTIIEPGGYLLIYASGLDEGLHTSFRLAREGEEVALSNALGQLVEVVAYDILQTDQAYSRQEDGTFTTSLAPTPGMANTTQSAALIETQFAARNSTGLVISEVAASTTQYAADWAEIHNQSAQSVDLSGYGLSDDAGKPRKWQFPQGTVIEPGEYLAIFFSGLDGTSGGVLHTSFRLAAEGGFGLVLSTPEGEIIDRVPVTEQYTDVTYGRVEGREGFYYMDTPTPNQENAGSVYQGKAQMAQVSVEGGLKDEAVSVELSAAQGARIYYTLDSSAPDETDTLYTGEPIAVSQTTVLRTRVYQDGLLPSYVDTQTYFYDIDHDMRVVSLVCEPDALFDETTGLYMRGPNASPRYPYTGANFWSEAEIEGHVEMFALDGTTMISQGCGVRLHGQYSRAEAQKAFKIIARNQYSGENRFHARIFSKRPYEQYQSFLLRGSGQDGDMTRMRDSVLQSLAENTSVMYQETELCVVYINGVYWGHYNIRERINKYSICQFEGWEGQEDDIDLIKANDREMQGSNATYENMLNYVEEHGIPDDETLERVGQVIDLQNYIEYHALEIFVGNGDTLNVKRYRNGNADGLWRYCLFDLDWAFYVDTNSIGRWLAPGGMGTNKYTDNTLFIALMANDTFRDRFLTYMGKMMATDWTTQNCMDKFNARFNQLQSEMPRHMERFSFSSSTYSSHIRRLRNYCLERPAKLLGYFQESMSLTDEQMQHYFGDALRAIEEYAENPDG